MCRSCRRATFPLCCTIAFFFTLGEAASPARIKKKKNLSLRLAYNDPNHAIWNCHWVTSMLRKKEGWMRKREGELCSHACYVVNELHIKKWNRELIKNAYNRINSNQPGTFIKKSTIEVLFIRYNRNGRNSFHAEFPPACGYSSVGLYIVDSAGLCCG